MRSLVVAILFSFGLQISAQDIPRDLLGSKEVEFFGMDFFFLWLIHQDGFVDKNGKPMCKSLPFKYFAEWNDLFVIERDKFSVTRYFSIPKYSVSLDEVTVRNKAYAFEEDCIIENEDYDVDEAQIQEAISHYNGKNSAGIGLTLFMVSLNKEKNIAVMHYAFFQIEDHSIIYHQRLTGTPVGMGFRNYWVNAMDNALEPVMKDFAKARKSAKK